jgi:hypothetical protein
VIVIVVVVPLLYTTCKGKGAYEYRGDDIKVMCHMHGCNRTGRQGTIPVRVDTPEDDSTKSNGEVHIHTCNSSLEN